MSVYSRQIHIGFDISQTGAGKAGCGFFAHAMLQALLESAPDHRYLVFPSFGDFYFDARMPLLNPYKNTQYGPRHLTRENAREFWGKPNLELNLDHPEIIQSNNFWCPLQLETSRLIYTFHDMGFVVNPAWTTETNRMGCFEGVFRSSIAADWIIATSEASKAHYLSIFPHFPKERIRVIYQCSRFMDLTSLGEKPKMLKQVLPQQFWLSVGTFEPRKNQRRLVEAYLEYLALGGQAMPLVLAGGKGWLMDDFQDYLRKVGLETQIILTGYLSDEELIWLYRNCYAHLYPSLFEGFGLPILEGMQFGAPTLASNSTSMPEVAGTAGMLLSPEHPKDWAEAMLKLGSDPTERKKLSEASLEQARKFDWKYSATNLLNLYEEAITTPKLKGSRQ